MRRPLGYNREQRAKRDRAVFASLIESPQTGAITLPANGRLYVKSIAGNSEGDTAAQINDRTIHTPALETNQVMPIGYIERGSVVTPGAGLELLVDMGLGRFTKIAEGASGPPDVWGPASVTIAYDTENDQYDFNSYTSPVTGLIIQANPAYPIRVIVTPGGGTISFEFEGNMTAFLSSVTTFLTFDGVSMTFSYWQLLAGEEHTQIVFLLGSRPDFSISDVGIPIPFEFTFTS